MDEQFINVVNGALEILQRIDTQTRRPWARRMAEEYMCQEDLDGDGLIFGHNFFLTVDFNDYPPVLQPIMREVTKRVEAGNWRGRLIPLQEYLPTLGEEDRKAVETIFPYG